MSAMKPAAKKILWGAGIVLALVIAAPLILIGPRNIIGLLRYDIRREGNYKVGDVAPDVTLLGTDGAFVKLRERIGKRPLVLVFGSFT
jgi:hypothetical protein